MKPKLAGCDGVLQGSMRLTRAIRSSSSLEDERLHREELTTARTLSSRIAQKVISMELQV